MIGLLCQDLTHYDPWCPVIMTPTLSFVQHSSHLLSEIFWQSSWWQQPGRQNTNRMANRMMSIWQLRRQNTDRMANKVMSQHLNKFKGIRTSLGRRSWKILERKFNLLHPHSFEFPKEFLLISDHQPFQCFNKFTRCKLLVIWKYGWWPIAVTDWGAQKVKSRRLHTGSPDIGWFHFQLQLLCIQMFVNLVSRTFSKWKIFS